MTQPGLLFAEDLCAHGPWIADRGREWLAGRGGGGRLLAPTIWPPPRMVLVVVPESLPGLWDRAPWLREVADLSLVVDHTADPMLRSNPDRRARLDVGLCDLALVLANVSSIHHAEPGDLEPSVVAARRLQKSQSVPTTWPSWPTERPPVPEPVAPSRWLAWAPARISPRLEPSLEDSLRILAAQVHLHDGFPAWLDAEAGERVDLQTGARHAVPEAAGVGSAHQPVAVALDGRRWLSPSIDRHTRTTTWRFGDREAMGSGGQAIGIDPSQTVAWSGRRCTFDWRVIVDGAAVEWMPNSHDWPCGHARKLYGFKDNDPLWVHLAPDASACLSVYEHDCLLAPGLPLRWREVGEWCVGERSRGEPRALFYQHASAPGDEPHAADPSLGDRDARDRFAVITLGPSEKIRYVVGLDAPTWRLRGKTAERIEVPSGWAAYDASHALVRRGRGRLLAGWDRWIVVLEGGRLRREDLLRGSAEDLGPCGHEVSGAVAVPGSSNAVLLRLDGDDAWLRLV